MREALKFLGFLGMVLGGLVVLLFALGAMVYIDMKPSLDVREKVVPTLLGSIVRDEYVNYHTRHLCWISDVDGGYYKTTIEGKDVITVKLSDSPPQIWKVE